MEHAGGAGVLPGRPQLPRSRRRGEQPAASRTALQRRLGPLRARGGGERVTVARASPPPSRRGVERRTPVAAVRLGDRAHDREPEARRRRVPRAAAALERLGQPRGHGRVDDRAAVDDVAARRRRRPTRGARRRRSRPARCSGRRSRSGSPARRSSSRRSPLHAGGLRGRAARARRRRARGARRRRRPRRGRRGSRPRQLVAGAREHHQAVEQRVHLVGGADAPSRPSRAARATSASGSASVTSASVRITVSGLRSSCARWPRSARARRRRPASSASSRPASAQPSAVGDERRAGQREQVLHAELARARRRPRRRERAVADGAPSASRRRRAAARRRRRRCRRRCAVRRTRRCGITRGSRSRGPSRSAAGRRACGAAS